MIGRRLSWALFAALVGSFVLGAAHQLPVRLALRLAGAGDLPHDIVVSGTVLSWRAQRGDGWQAQFDGSWPSLLLGRYAGVLDLERGTAHFHGHVTRDWRGTLAVSGGQLTADIAPLAGALGLPQSLIDGQLEVHDIAALWRAGSLVALDCAGEVRGVRAGLGVDSIAVGDLGVACATEAGGPSVAVEDRGGPLVFHSAIRFGADGRFVVDGTAGTRPGAPAILVDALPLLGRAAGPDRVSFRYGGALPHLAPR